MSDLSIDRTGMTARVSHRSNTDRSEERNVLYPSITSELPLSQSVSNSQSVKSDLSRPRSPPSTSIVRKLAESCMVWRHRLLQLTSTSTASRSSVFPLVPLVSKRSNNSDKSEDPDQDEALGHILAASTSTSTFKHTDTSWDCISSLINEHRQPDVSHGQNLEPIHNVRTTSQDDGHTHLHNSMVSLSSQTIYDGEVFGRDYGSSGGGESARVRVSRTRLSDPG